MADPIKFITLDVWGKNQAWIHDYITIQDSKSLKTVSLSSDRTKLLFYKIENPTADTLPAFEIEIPSADLSTVIKKVTDAIEGNVAVFGSGGSLKDTGIDSTKLVTTDSIEPLILEKISQSQHMKKVVVTELPDPADADANTFYLIKIDTATGSDKYEIWTKIGDELILIDDTSVDLENYVTKTDAQDMIAIAKSEAISSAVEQALASAQVKIEESLAVAKSYTDDKISPITIKVSDLETNVTGIQDSITTINSNISSLNDKMTNIENKVGNMEIATESEMLEAFNTAFGMSGS